METPPSQSSETQDKHSPNQDSLPDTHRSLLFREDRHAFLPTQADNFVFTQEEGQSGFDDDGIDAGLGGGLDGAGADNGNVEAEVLVGLGNFHHHGLPLAECAAALEGFVGAFESFNGEHGAFFHDYGLADVEVTDFFGNAKTEGGIVALAIGQLGTAHVPGLGSKSSR